MLLQILYQYPKQIDLLLPSNIALCWVMYMHHCPHQLPFMQVVVNHFIVIDQQPRLSTQNSLLYYYSNSKSVSYIHIYCQEMEILTLTKVSLQDMLTQWVSNYVRMQTFRICHTELLRPYLR